MRAVYALRRAISAVCAVACSSRMITSTWPARSTTATDVLKPFALHSACAASAMIFAIPSERLRCITMPCAPAWPDPMAARPMARIVTRYDMRRILARVTAADGAEQPIELGHRDPAAHHRERPLTRDLLCPARKTRPPRSGQRPPDPARAD